MFTIREPIKENSTPVKQRDELFTEMDVLVVDVEVPTKERDELSTVIHVLVS